MNVTLSNSGAPPWPEGLSLRKLPIPASSFARRIGLIWTRASLRLRLVQAFLELAATDPAAPKAHTRKPKGYAPTSPRGALLGHHRGTSAAGPWLKSAAPQHRGGPPRVSGRAIRTTKGNPF